MPQNGLVPRKGAAMLIGEYQHNIDAKGRVIVPAKFREDLGDCFYVTKGLDGPCLLFRRGMECLAEKDHSHAHFQSQKSTAFFLRWRRRSGAGQARTDFASPTASGVCWTGKRM